MDKGNPAPGFSIEAQIGLLKSRLDEIIRRSPFSLSFTIEKTAAHAEDAETPEYVVAFSGADADLLLEKNATLLHAMEHVALKAIHMDDDHMRLIAFDCNGWRQMRMDELRLMAQVAAERVVDSGSPFALSPMNSRERRIIHLALRDHPEVQTQSEGAGPERKVVILPAKPSDGGRIR